MALKILLLVGRFFNRFLKILIPLYIIGAIALGVYFHFHGTGVNVGMVVNAVMGVFTLMLFGSLDYWFMSRKVSCKWCGEVFMLCDTEHGICKSCRLHSTGPSANRKREDEDTLDYKQFTLTVVAIAGLATTIQFRSAATNDSPSKRIESPSDTVSISEQSEAIHTPQTHDENIHESKTATGTQSEYSGLWEGDFGNSKIQISIDAADSSGAIKGYNILKGKKRELSGSYRDGVIVLNEPGDDPWDGVFEITMTDTKCTGNWKSNNGKLRRDFELLKVN